jgi:hypothetical protein
MFFLLFLELLSWVFFEFQVPTFCAHIDVLDWSFNLMFFIFGYEFVSDLGSAPSSSIL